jgi:Cft2 family RNA processing exonuclease
MNFLQEDMRKVAVERKGESNFFTSQMIKDCMKKVVAVTLHQSVMVDKELEIKAYYAGHVLGAAMFRVTVGSQSVVYTVSFLVVSAISPGSVLHLFSRLMKFNLRKLHL